ncbi:rhamnan synthesis F family protein [Paraburkholderia sp. J94]|uniref:rhamnan synthesis F family protein n=1 Tax=Paraburkholderia sp. J94 TaxID=2805441 RepID=UPI002AB2BB21|nr:rhamnan synthesis F family protein [Paraburkholderia sp. J94]
MNPPERRRTLILVAGPPRGGNAELAQLLRMAGAASRGASVPDEAADARLASDVDAFQRHLFAALDSEWDDPWPIPTERLERTAASAAFSRAVESLLGDVEARKDIVVDDPGLARLLPLWYAAAHSLECETVTLIPLRHPEDIVTSRWLRDALARPLALAVWLESVLSAEQASRAQRRLFIRHDSFVSDWRAGLQATTHQLEWPQAVNTERFTREAERVLLGVRSRPLDSALSLASGDRMGELVNRAWSALLALLDNPDDAAAQAALDAVRAELQPAYELYGDVIGGMKGRLDANLERMDRALGASGEVESPSHVVAQQEVQTLRDQISNSETHVAELEDQLTRLEAYRKQETVDARGLERVIEDLRLEKAALNSEIRRARQEADDLRATLETHEGGDREREITRAYHEASAALAQARSELGLLRSSISWRASAPLRVLARSVPRGVRGRVQGLLRFGWRAITPWRNAQRRFFAERMAHAALQSQQSDGAEAADQRTAQVMASPEDLRVAHVISHSEYFDAAGYAARSGATASGMDPALHYVLYGEARGIMPSDKFDPSYYGERYPDIVAWGGNRLGHFAERGIAEGRYGLPAIGSIPMPVDKLDPAKPTVLVVVHEASRTGAPILGWNISRVLKQHANVVAVVLRPGALDASFASVADAVVGAQKVDLFNAIDGFYFGRRLADVYRPLYVIANSVETRSLVPGLADRGVPVVALVHEFSGYTKPVGSLQTLYEQAAEVVFPADIVRRSSEADYPLLKLRHTNVLPQGPSEVPKSAQPKRTDASKPKAANVLEKLRPAGAEDALLVVGMGFVDWRKGVDLFVGALTSLTGRHPDAHVRFVWVGHGFKVSDTLDIASYLAEQVERSGVSDRFTFVDAVENVEDVYAQADVLFLSSRLDPLPNVSIDAALRGIPVVCFADASGMAEILGASQATRALVVPHLDAGAAAEIIAHLANDRASLQAFGQAIQELAQERFNMQRYVASVDALGRKAIAGMQREATDVQTILQSEVFDSPLFLGAQAETVPLPRAVHRYVAQASKIDYASLPVSGAYTRRPAAGFHPYTYARANMTESGERTDPYAHYLRAGKPAGPWAHQVIRADEAVAGEKATALKVALHAHIYYPELVGELLDAVAVNHHACRLIFTTDTEDKAAEINLLTERSGLPADVQVVGNRGRDIGPFLLVLAEIGDQYDIIGHVHGKRSLTTENVASDFGERWREFLWQHLIGDSAPMMDRIMREFARDPRLGLVFPEDPHLIGWEENLELGKQLAGKMGLKSPLPLTLDFPVGTMFWARPEALRPFLTLGLSADDYPEEPLPTDGTILHAMERLITCAALESGFDFATTFLPDYTR